jgi:hypothetical protein
LSFADLRGADLSYSTLQNASFDGSDLTDANLCEADLSYANFNGAILTGVIFERARCSKTSFARIEGLHRARELESIRWGNDCAIDVHTLRASIAGLADDTLLHLGIEANEIAALRALLSGVPPAL